MDAQETRATFRNYAVNDSAIYGGIERVALNLSAQLRAAIEQVNREHAAQTGEPYLITSDADRAAAIDVFLSEIREIVEFDITGRPSFRSVVK